jgi:hypothetical protein
MKGHFNVLDDITLDAKQTFLQLMRTRILLQKSTHDKERPRETGIGRMSVSMSIRRMLHSVTGRNEMLVNIHTHQCQLLQQRTITSANNASIANQLS